jgi:hypothetical protein
MRKLLTGLVLAVVAACDRPTEPQDAPLYVYVLMGQSKMMGTGSPVGYRAPDLGDRALVLRDNGWETAREPLMPTGVGAGVSFAATMLAARPTVRIGLVHCVQSGAPIPHFLPGTPFYEACLARIARAARDGRIMGVLFAQGESDGLARPDSDPTHWQLHFERIVQTLRTDLTQPTLPVAFTQLGALDEGWLEGAPRQTWASVQQQQARVSLSATVMVPTLDLTLSDGLHFTTPGYVELGRRFGTALVPFTPQP